MSRRVTFRWRPLDKKLGEAVFATRISNQRLGTLCERVGVSFEVGLDPHRVFERESEGRRSTYGRKMQQVAKQVRQGGSLAEAVRSTGNYFPPHFAETIEAGERTGRLDRVLDRLGEYYHQQAEFRKTFWRSILWPLIQAGLAVLIVAGMIYLPEVIVPGASEEEKDLLGIGLVGTKGLMVYSAWVGVCLAVALGLLYLAKRGVFGFLVDWSARLPFVGRTFRVFAEARFVQTLALAIESGIDAWSAVDLAFRCAGTPQYTSRAEPAKNAILQGRDMHVVLENTKLFSRDTLEAVQLGEDSGRLAETLDKQFKQLKSHVKSSMGVITYVASGLIWIAIVALLIFIIFHVFSMYIDKLGDAGAAAFGQASSRNLGE